MADRKRPHSQISVLETNSIIYYNENGTTNYISTAIDSTGCLKTTPLNVFWPLPVMKMGLT